MFYAVYVLFGFAELLKNVMVFGSKRISEEWSKYTYNYAWSIYAITKL